MNFGLFAAPLLALDSPTAIEGEYIVVFKGEIGNDASKSIMLWGGGGAVCFCFVFVFVCLFVLLTIL